MAARPNKIAVKRIYDESAPSDGYRVLVDRLWPRGLTKAAAHVDLWLKNVAPSNELRKWFHAHSEHWREFRAKYLKELREPEPSQALAMLYELLENNGTVTLLFSSKDLDRNNATVLKDFVQGIKKPPTGPGPIRGAKTQTRRRTSR